MKKSVLGLSISLLLITTLVLAQPASEEIAEGTKNVLVGIGEGISSFLQPLFGEKEMLSRVFLAFLLFLLIYSVMDSFFEGKKILTLATSIIITGLALLAIPSNFLEAIRTTYGAMGAALLSLIPFAILVFFTLKVNSRLLAHIVWIFFVVYYFALYLYEIFASKAGFWSGDTLPYIGAIVAGILMIIFVGPLRNLVIKGQMSALKEKGEKTTTRGKLLHQLQKEEIEGYNV